MGRVGFLRESPHMFADKNKTVVLLLEFSFTFPFIRETMVVDGGFAGKKPLFTLFGSALFLLCRPSDAAATFGACAFSDWPQQ
jgi:hypothetical protein